MSIFLIIPGILFSLASGFVTWLTWKDSRASFLLISRLDLKISQLEERISKLESEQKNELLKS